MQYQSDLMGVTTPAVDGAERYKKYTRAVNRYLRKERGQKILSIGENTEKISGVQGQETKQTDERQEPTTVNTLTAGGHSVGHHSSMTLIHVEKQKEKEQIIYDRKGFDSRTKGFRESRISPTLSTKMGTGGNNVPMVEEDIIIIGSLQKNSTKMINCCPTLTQAMGNGGGHVPMVEDKVVCHSLQPRSPDRPSLKYSKGGSGHLSRSDGNSYCLDAGNTMAVEKGLTGQLRRLTPTECEFLQAFSRNWTAKGFDAEKNIETNISDSQRYKQLGNAVTVNVIDAIIKRLNEVE